MYFLMVCKHIDSPGINAKRDEIRPQHREWVVSGGNGVARVLTGSALWNENEQAIGNFGVLEAESESQARAFAEGDPFASAGLVDEITIIRLADGFRAERIEPMTQS